MMKIKLTKNKYAIVDDEDFEYLNQWKWCASISNDLRRCYAQRRLGKLDGFAMISMHRLVIKAENGFVVDHINGDTLDNRKCNLRVCSIAENTRNASKPLNNKSGFKGVVWDVNRRKWKSQIKYNRVNINIGRFNTAIEAARAYNEAAIKYHGEFANLNELPA